MHRTTEQFWQRYWALPAEVRASADRSFQLLKDNPRHFSLRFKKTGGLGSARVGLVHRALAVEEGNDYLWVWIGAHDEYVSPTTVLSSGQVSDRPETLDRKVSKGCESTGFEETCRSGERRGQETLAEHIRAKYGCSIRLIRTR